MAAWEEIVDYTVPSNTSRVDLTGLNITKDDFIKFVINLKNPGSGSEMGLFANNETLSTNYYEQHLQAYGTGISASKINRNSIGPIEGGENGIYFGFLKISEDDKLNIFSNINWSTDPSNQLLRYVYVTSTINFSSINSFSIIRDNSSASIDAGSRIQIYRLNAEKVADITVASDTTQVDITGLNIDKGSEYLLVTNMYRNTGASYIGIHPNGLTTNTDYYTQRIRGDGSSSLAYRSNINIPFQAQGNSLTVNYSHIKLSNIGAFTVQGYSVFESGTSQVQIWNSFVSSTFENITNINQINLKAHDGDNLIASPTRFELYKLY